MYLAVVGALDATARLPDGLVPAIAELVAAGDDAAAGALIPDKVLDRFAFSGTPEHVAAQARAVIEAGAGRVDFGTPHGLTDADGISLLGTRVLPLLREPTLSKAPRADI
jgi:5,10-methylenetetrahydromethanopterin reductase